MRSEEETIEHLRSHLDESLTAAEDAETKRHIREALQRVHILEETRE